MKKPNFFIAGSPRCGTTALYTYLSEHPQIFMPEVKEIHYFSDDFANIRKIAWKTRDDYLKLFERADKSHLAVGEASPFYLFSKSALQNIHAFDPNAKIIITIRNPIEFVQSLHQLNVSLLRETEVDFRQAWQLEPLRRQGLHIPPSARHAEILFYSELGQFGKHIERLFNIFPRDQVKIVLLEELSQNPRRVYKEILSFLNVPDDGRTVFPQINAGFKNRSNFIAKILHPPAKIYDPVLKTVSLLGPDFMKVVSMIFSRLERLNTTRASRDPINPELRAHLLEYFSPDIEKLSALIERDLSAWKI